MAFTGNKPGYVPGPRQPQVLADNDETTHAERERALLAIARVADEVQRGVLPADDALRVLRAVFRRVRDAE